MISQISPIDIKAVLWYPIISQPPGRPNTLGVEDQMPKTEAITREQSSPSRKLRSRRAGRDKIAVGSSLPPQSRFCSFREGCRSRRDHTPGAVHRPSPVLSLSKDPKVCLIPTKNTPTKQTFPGTAPHSRPKIAPLQGSRPTEPPPLTPLAPLLPTPGGSPRFKHYPARSTVQLTKWNKRVNMMGTSTKTELAR
jgi:hypothetical protein